MRRLDTETIHTRQASYFGLMSLLSFLTLKATLITSKHAHHLLPKTVAQFSALLFIASSIICIYFAFKARKEPKSKQKLKMKFLVGFSILFWVLLVSQLSKEILGTFGSN